MEFTQVSNYGGYLDFECEQGMDEIIHCARVTFYRDETGHHCYMTTRLAFTYGDTREALAEIPCIEWEEGEKLVGRKVDPNEIKI